MRARAALLAALLLAALPCAADLRILRDPRAKVERILGARLEDDQAALVDIVLAFYAVKYGYLKAGAEDGLKAAVRAMSEEEYAHATEKAAMVAASKTARTFLKMGKYGEKALKALIVVAEDAAKDLDRFIQDKAIEFDARH